MSEGSVNAEDVSSEISTESSKPLSSVEESGIEEVSSRTASNVPEGDHWQLSEESDAEDSETVTPSPTSPSQSFEELLNSEIFWDTRFVGEFQEFSILGLARYLRKMGHSVDSDDLTEYLNHSYDLEAANEYQEECIPQRRPDNRGFTLEDPDPKCFRAGRLSRLCHAKSSLFGKTRDCSNECMLDRDGK
ncbi:hypothetical protein M514_11834 [Trichuris suis]|uniref:Uncharacterized protein n=1 Tax=Trichuris suis TaxID=68888 RepID=A0A085LQN5_9BILA|nr:hypothetical protein M513_11834 [Trichuris suis]KFD60636.1 hypothetical protein M514_11834 [Trichuris suis]